MSRTPFIKVIFLLLFVFLLLPTQVKAQQNGQNLYSDTKYYFSIVFPDGWNIEEGRNTHIIVKSTSKNGEGLESINIGVRTLPNNIKDADITEIVDAKGLISEIDAQLLDSGVTYIDNNKSLWAKYKTSYSTVDITVYGVGYQVVSLHNNYLYFITAMAGGLTEEEASQNYSLIENTFKDSIRSFQFEDWNKPETDSVANNTSNSNPTDWMIMLINFILTWGIGLSSPLFVRFVLVKKAIDKQKAIIISIVLGLINLIIFASLGSESKTHATLFIIGSVSYWILHRGYKQEK